MRQYFEWQIRFGTVHLIEKRDKLTNLGASGPRRGPRKRFSKIERLVNYIVHLKKILGAYNPENIHAVTPMSLITY